MKSIVAAASFATFVAASDPDYNALWSKFKDDYNKDYSGNGEDEQKRFEIFKTNVDHINTVNAKKLSYWLGINEFTDLTPDEFFASHLGYNSGSPLKNLPKEPFPNITDVPDSIDWVAKGAVTPVKNQGQCGSCWAFSSTGALEGAYFVASNKLVSLSEEDLVQCNSVTDQGCDGGLMDNAFKWVETNGICTETAYPYTSGGGITGSCKKGCSPAVTITGYTDVPAKNEDALKAAVAQQPVSVAIEADKSVFQSYQGGILDSPACGTNLDHGVLAVGYGTDGSTPYWKVKNSWGASWGEQGYIRMVRGQNECGIAQEPSYPTGAKAAGPSPPAPPAPPAPTPAPAPPPPSGSTHYEKPPCRSDETIGNIDDQDVLCAPKCTEPQRTCPMDKPSDVTATPTCMLQDSSSGDEFCALLCYKDTDCDQAGGSKCTKTQYEYGSCTYPASPGPSPPGPSPPGPSPPPSPPTPPSPPGASHYEKPPCGSDESQRTVTDVNGTLCAPTCDQDDNCPSDVPAGVSAEPYCMLKDSSGAKYCALLCQDDSQCDTAHGGSCGMAIPPNIGVCVYGATAAVNAEPLRIRGTQTKFEMKRLPSDLVV